MEKKTEEKKKSNALNMFAVVAIGLVIIIALAAYIGGRDVAFTEEEEVMLEEPKQEEAPVAQITPFGDVFEILLSWPFLLLFAGVAYLIITSRRNYW